MKFALFQGSSDLADTQSNLAKIATIAKSAATQGAELVMFPELFLTGYDLRERTRRVAESKDGSSFVAISKIAIEHNIGILYGYPELVGDDCFNSAQFVSPAGESISNYRKLHLFGPHEKAQFVEGDAIKLVDFAGLKIGILICYDVEFPEMVRRLALAGADMIAVPTAIDPPYKEIATSVIRSRAFENQVFVAYANHCGCEGEQSYVGLSGIVGPDGCDLVRAGESEEALLVTNICPANFEESFTRNTYLRDRRPELYQDLSNRLPDRLSGS